MAERYIRLREERGAYAAALPEAVPARYLRREGWEDVAVDGEMIYSHRDTFYTKETFTEGMHAHDYYELLFFLSGEVDYLNEGRHARPAAPSAVLFRPGQMHTARLRAASRYERFVLYFSPSFFRCGERTVPVADFPEDPECFVFSFDETRAAALRGMLRKAERAVHSGAPYAELLLKACLTELFCFLHEKPARDCAQEPHEDAMEPVRRYIDAAYSTPFSLDELARRFYYSRSYLSRRFRQIYNISLSDYLCRRRITASLSLLPHMKVSDAAYAVGFRSQSAFIAAFRKNVGCLPSAYRNRRGAVSEDFAGTSCEISENMI